MTVSLSTLIGLYVMIPLACLLGFWLYDQWRQRLVSFVITRRIMISCEICLHKFYCDRDASLAECPQCGSLNKVDRHE